MDAALGDSSGWLERPVRRVDRPLASEWIEWGTQMGLVGTCMSSPADAGHSWRVQGERADCKIMAWAGSSGGGEGSEGASSLVV